MKTPKNLEDSLAGYEHLRTWQHDTFRLELYDTREADRRGKSILAYQLFDNEHGDTPVFQGADFACSPLHAIDSDATLGGLLGFLSLQPGDTDREYFEPYTPSQRAWAQTRAEALGLCAYELELAGRYQSVDHEIMHEPWDAARAAGRHNRALVLKYQSHEVTLDAGESDSIDVLTDGETTYALSVNYGLGYVGMQAFVSTEETGNFFCQNAEEEVARGFLDLGSAEMIRVLVEYL